MIEIKAKLVADRISLARAGSRARRLPTIVLGTGAVIKLSPGRSVKVTEEVFSANRELLSQFEGLLDIIGVEPEPAPVEPEPAPVEPEPVETESASTKKRRRRRSKAEIEADKKAKAAKDA